MRLAKVSAAVVLLVASLARAEEKKSLVELVPADSLFFVRWAGSNNISGYGDSKFAALLAEMNLPQWWETTLPALVPPQARGTPHAAMAMELIRSIATYAMENESLLYSTGEGMTEDLRAEPQVTFVIRFPSETLAKEAERSIQDLITQLVGAQPIPNVQFYRSGTDIALKVKDLTDRSPLEKPKMPMQTSVIYTDAMQEVARDGAPIEMFLNVDKAVAMADRDHEAEADWEKKMAITGLRGIHAVAVRAGFDGADFASHAFMLMDPPAERKGVVGAIATTRPAVDLSVAIPADAVSVTTFSLDLADLFERVKREGEALEPGFSQKADAYTGAGAGLLGLPLADFLANWGKDFALIGLPGDEPSTWQYVLLSKPVDAAKAKAHLASLAAGVNRLLLIQKSPFAPLTFTPGDISALERNGLQVAWGITSEGNLVMGVSKAAVEHVLKSRSQNSPSSVQKKLNAPVGAAISWSNLPQSAGPMYIAWASTFRERLRPMPEWMAALPIPSGEQVQRLMVPGGSATWVTEKGLHYRSITPIPAAEALSATWALAVGKQALSETLSKLQHKLANTQPAQ